MNLKLFLSTFVLIFLAELGDKTQLAAMARSAAGGGKWTVFAAASSALVLSTLIAVLAGSLLPRFVPEKYIKIGAGALFLMFGTVILVNAFKPSSDKGVLSKGMPKGLIAKTVFNIAAEFESASISDYEALATGTNDPSLKAVLLSLAEEEKIHLKRIKGYEVHDHGDKLFSGGELPEMPDLSHDAATSQREIISHAIEHEEATSRFYHELAKLSKLPSMKVAFATLAEEERKHIEELKRFLKSPSNT